MMVRRVVPRDPSKRVYTIETVRQAVSREEGMKESGYLRKMGLKAYIRKSPSRRRGITLKAREASRRGESLFDVFVKRMGKL